MCNHNHLKKEYEDSNWKCDWGLEMTSEELEEMRNKEFISRVK